MPVDEALILVFEAMALSASIVLALSVQSSNSSTYCRLVAEALNSTAMAVPPGGDIKIILPRPVHVNSSGWVCNVFPTAISRYSGHAWHYIVVRKEDSGLVEAVGG